MFLSITFLFLSFIGLGLVIYGANTGNSFIRGLGAGICIPVAIHAISVLLS